MNRTSVIAVVVAVLLVLGALGGTYLALRADNGSAQDTGSQATDSQVTGSQEPGETSATDPCSDATAEIRDPQQYDAPPPASGAENAVWTATIETSCGTVVADLDGQVAPQTVASFLFLSGEGYFDATGCHRLTTSGIFVLQCGDPTGSGSGGPGYGYGIENPPADGSYPAGTLAMARSADPDSNGSQFFIVYDDSTIDPSTGGYTIFGTITEGLDIVQYVAAQGADDVNGPGDGAPNQPIVISSIEVVKA